IKLVDLGLMPLQARFGGGLSGPLVLLQRADLSELGADLPAALLIALFALGQLQMLQLALVVALLERDARGAQLRQPLVVLAERMLELGKLLALLVDLLSARSRVLLQPLDFALAGEYPGVRRIGSVEADAEAAELMAVAVDEDHLRRQA